MLKYKKTAFSSAFLSSLVFLASCGGAQDPLVFIPPPTPSIPIGSEPSQNYTDLSAEQIEAIGPCIPSVPLTGQSIEVQAVATDPFAESPSTPGGGIFNNGIANLTYAFNEGEFTIASSEKLAYIPNYGGAYDQGTGLVTTNYSAILEDPMGDSAVALNPSDWAQQLARKLNNAAIGETASIQLELKARGLLPNLLAPLVVPTDPDTGEPLVTIDPQKEALLGTYTVTATREADGAKTVAGQSIPVCNFSFKIDRPYQVKDPAIFTPGEHGPYTIGNITDTAPWNLTVSSEQDAIDALGVSGPGLEFYVNDNPLKAKLFLEPHIPSFKGTFATSNQIPFVPVELSWEHTYGISAPTFPRYLNSTGELGEKAIPTPDGKGPATQKFIFVSSTS